MAAPGFWVTFVIVLALGLAPIVTQSASTREVMFTILLAIGMAVSLNIILGYTGYVSFGHVVFFGLGGYLGMYLIDSWNAPLPLAVLGGGMITALLALALGASILRLRGAYFALATIGINEAARTFVANFEPFGGPTGIELQFRVYRNYGGPTQALWITYYSVVGITLFAVIFSYLIKTSKFGLGLMSIREEEKQLTCLVGSNGVGKTTMLRTVMGLIRPWKGSIRFDGKDIGGTPAYAKADLGLVLAPEGRQLFTEMTVEENLEMGAANRRARPNAKKNLERVYEMFPRLKERRQQKAGILSGGEQQMLAVGRGIMAKPVVLMIDELSLGLAPVLSLQLFQSLRQLRQEGLTILLVEQNVQMALAISDYGYVLAEGKVEIEGPARELAQNQHIRAAYLGL